MLRSTCHWPLLLLLNKLVSVKQESCFVLIREHWLTVTVHMPEIESSQ
jgi:hypothetical protein